MTDRERLASLFPESEILEQDDRPGTLFEVQNDRDPFGDEILLIRFLETEPDYERYKTADIQLLEEIFYDEETPNPWNIQLFWVYADGTRPPKTIRDDLEKETRFAIRRVVPQDLLEDFIAPLEQAKGALENISDQFNRGDLIQDIFDEGVGFLFNDSTRDEKFDRLRQGDYSEKVARQKESIERDPIQRFVSEVKLGEFREDQVVFSRMDTSTFTLLYGPNASGKTSLLDATTLGLVGQIRHPEARVKEYSDLEVTLEGHSGPLDTDASSLKDRVADWFGYRPYGRQSKCEEFYRVNYLEAGQATRIVDPDLNIQQTLERFLHGEELTAAINDKQELEKRLEKTIENNEWEMEDRAEQVAEREETLERVEEIFSELRAAARSLSPGALELVTQDRVGKRDEPQPAELETWSEWTQRFEMIETSLDALPAENPSQRSPEEIHDELIMAIDRVMANLDLIEEYREQESRRRQLTDLDQYWTADEKESTPAPVALISIILGYHELTARDLTALKEAVPRATEFDDFQQETTSVLSWQKSMTARLNSHLQDLEKRKAQIEELSDIEARREELRAEIRSKTEEYLSIVEDVNYCPACYVEQNREAILYRHEPSEEPPDRTPDESSSIEEQIELARRALEAIERIDWQDVSYTITSRFQDECDFEDFQEFWRRHFGTENALRIPAVATLETAKVFAKGISETATAKSRTPPTETVLYEAQARIDEQLEEMRKEISALESTDEEIQPTIDRLERRRERLEAGVQILEEYWPEAAWTEPVDIANDRRVMETTLERLEEEPASLELTTDIEEEIQHVKGEIEEIREETDTCKESIERLNQAFRLADDEEQLNALVKDHLAAISTLFTAFQRPYEFRRVDLRDGDIILERRDTGEEVGPEALSAGQRAALALAIFVTNNLAHETAPPIMLLDEPFAHLDDVNTVAFFNLLIELATRRDRQIFFATANRDIADLIERKAGNADEFDRQNIPRAKAGLDAQ